MRAGQKPNLRTLGDVFDGPLSMAITLATNNLLFGINITPKNELRNSHGSRFGVGGAGLSH